MITRLLFIATLSLTSIVAAETTTEDLLRQGLFEEEANRDFDKASERYRAVVAAHDRQRSLAATATFRLGEIARKKNERKPRRPPSARWSPGFPNRRTSPA